LVDLFRERKWDLVHLRNLWFAISLLIILPGVAFWSTRGLNYGIDFKGGGLITYKLAQPLGAGGETEALAKARTAIEKTGIEARVQVAGTAMGKDQLLVRTRIVREPTKSEEQVRSEQQAKIQAALDQAFPGIRTVAAEMVTPVVSKELLWNAVWSVVAGLVALVHDVLVLIGVFAMTYREINSPFVAAALTVVGFSVHDTIVIFDRIRENLRLRKGATFAETANISLLETMARSVNTVLTVELVLIAMYLLGGVSLRDFTFAMIVGVTVGAYSSIFNASQLMVVLKNREERALARRRALGGRPAATAPARSTRPVSARPTRAASPAATTRPEAPRPQAEPMAGRAELVETPAPVGQGASTTRPAGKPATRPAGKKLKAGRKRKKRF